MGRVGLRLVHPIIGSSTGCSVSATLGGSVLGREREGQDAARLGTVIDAEFGQASPYATLPC